MDTPYAKPLPVISDLNRGFWEACKLGKLSMQQCDKCAHIRYPIGHNCPKCLAYEWHWQELSGNGAVFSYVVFYQLYNKAFAQDVPYNVALVQLDEGPRMYSNVTGVDNDEVKVGDRLRVHFEAVTPEITLPRFTLVR